MRAARLAMVTAVCLLGACPAGTKARVTGSTTAQRAEELLRSSTNPARVACVQCHLLPGEDAIRPGPPLGGASKRGVLKGQANLPLVEAIAACARTYQQRPLPAGVALELAGHVATLEGPSTTYDVTPRNDAEVRELMALDADGYRGEQVFQRACTVCHGDGPGPSRNELGGQAALEVLYKVLGARGPNDRMVPFTRGTLSDQDARDVAEFLGGQG